MGLSGDGGDLSKDGGDLSEDGRGSKQSCDQSWVRFSCRATKLCLPASSILTQTTQSRQNLAEQRNCWFDSHLERQSRV